MIKKEIVIDIQKRGELWGKPFLYQLIDQFPIGLPP